MRLWVRLFLLVLLPSANAVAATHRVAVLVGNNDGSGERPPLRYAESDATKLAATLLELGGVSAGDLELLTGSSIASVRAALRRAAAKVTRLRRDPADRIVLIFYFSGHSDGEALEIGTGRLGFAELRGWLADSGAAVRLAIVDSCRSGALLAEKSGTPGPAFQIRLTDELASTGEALLTSSAADEVALESREIRGSFFTHHLVSGLRGAADASGDGVVTLGEAYQYAFAHTVSATAGTLPGPQHPAYDYRLTGEGDLVLATLVRPTAALDLPGGYARILVVQLARDQVLAELSAGAARRLAVPAGEYGVRAWRSGRTFAARVFVRAGETRAVRPDQLDPADSKTTRSKGGEIEYSFPIRRSFHPGFWGHGHPTLFAAAGVQAGAAAPALGSLRLGVRANAPSGVALHLGIASGRGRGFAETSVLGWLGYRLGFERVRFSGFLGFEVGAGAIMQSPDLRNTLRTATVGAALWPGVSLRVSPRAVVALEAEVPLLWVRKDGNDTVTTLPAAWLGFAVAL
jgi:hypothetical protein